MRTVLTGLALSLLLVSSAVAQPPGRPGEGGGPGFGSRGGFGGGEGFSSRGGDSGGSRGGPPGGGFPGGGFPGGGFPGGSRGGPPSDSSRGGSSSGFRGGDSGGGSRGGDSGRGGFDPSEMLSRFDTNGNKMIDPSEAQGPAQFFLQRLAQSNPKIDLKKPIPISQLTEEISRMRGGDSGGGSTSRESDEPELLVPNFSLDYVPEPVMGFGAGSSVFNVKVEERDLKEAEDRLSRYDRDRNGLLNKEELQAGRWSDDPMQYDRNRDGQLNKSEMAVRYANRRVQDEERRNASNDSRSNSSRDSSRGGGENGWGRRGEAQPEEEEVARFGDAKSYRSASGAAAGTSGLPDFFARSDADGDGQVLMSEFSSSWTQSTLEEFQKWDLNKDGIIIASECLAALDAGTRVTASASSAPAGGSTPGASRPTSVAGSGGSSSPVAIGGTQMEWATRQIEKYDKNGDGQLTASEWEAMIIKPIGADANGDGILTAEEYAEFRAKK